MSCLVARNLDLLELGGFTDTDWIGKTVLVWGTAYFVHTSQDTTFVNAVSIVAASRVSEACLSKYELTNERRKTRTSVSLPFPFLSLPPTSHRTTIHKIIWSPRGKKMSRATRLGAG
jgi:hypothetical protein